MQMRPVRKGEDMKKLALAAVLPLLLVACGGETTESPAAEAPADAAAAPVAAEEELGGEDGGEGADEATLAAAGTNARCVTEPLDSDVSYDGACTFEALGGGSFVITPPEGEMFSDDATEFVIEVDAPGVAGMSMRVGGELNFLGTATQDGACWNSESYMVCAYN